MSLRAIDGGNRGTDTLEDERLHEAQLAVMRGYERAVELLSPGPGQSAHGRLFWYEEGLADARQIAGLPRVRVLEDAQQQLPAPPG